MIDGSFKIFSSAHGEIKPEALLASAAIPNLFPAVQVDGHAYWDGIFASNPPIAPLLSKAPMNGHALPEEIWIIQINRAHHCTVPETPSDIFDRRNQLAGNLSLQHELELLRIVNLILQEYPEAPDLFARFGLNMSQPIKVRFLRMSSQLAESLDYPSKLSRHPAHIAPAHRRRRRSSERVSRRARRGASGRRSPAPTQRSRASRSTDRWAPPDAADGDRRRGCCCAPCPPVRAWAQAPAEAKPPDAAHNRRNPRPTG